MTVSGVLEQRLLTSVGNHCLREAATLPASVFAISITAM